MQALQKHFKACAERNGNPNGVCFDADLSCDLGKELAELKKRAAVQVKLVANKRARTGHL